MTTDISTHFVNCNPLVKEAFDKIYREIHTLEDVKSSSVKNSILFSAESTFLAVKTSKEFLELEFILKETREEFPVYKVFQYTQNKTVHFVKISDPDEVDNQLLGWLRDSHEQNIRLN